MIPPPPLFYVTSPCASSVGVAHLGPLRETELPGALFDGPVRAGRETPWPSHPALFMMMAGVLFAERLGSAKLAFP
jgi:hypothetical protein